VRDAVRRYGRLFQYVDDLQDIGGVADALGKPTGLDSDNHLQTLPAADLVVSTAAVTARLHELADPIAAFVQDTQWAASFTAMTNRLLDGAARVLDAPSAR
jgi:geranylgeranyl pyrophosphate synthase